MGDIKVQAYPPEEAFCIQGRGRPQADVSYETIDGGEPQKEVTLSLDGAVIDKWIYTGKGTYPTKTLQIAEAGSHTLEVKHWNGEIDVRHIVVESEETPEKVRFLAPDEGQKFKPNEQIGTEIEVY
jgi:hypothetical protein